jgi:hypothetical protein
VLEGNWLLGKRTFKVDSAKRWQYTADSAGLLVLTSGDLGKRADDASKLAGLGYDAYDVRVEGELTAEVALRYIDKGIVLPSVNSSLGDGSAAAIKAFLDAGGRVLAGEAEGAQRTAVGSVLAAFENNVASLSVEDLTVYSGNQFKAGDTKAIVVEANDIRAGSTAKAAADLLEFDLVRKSFTEKVSAYVAAVNGGVQSRIATASDAVIYELTREMADNKAIDGNNFNNNKAALKLTAYVNTALSKQGGERRGLLLLEPRIEDARTHYEKDGWFRSTPIHNVLKPLEKAYNQEVLGRKGN